MATYDIGDLVRLTGTFTSAGGVATDPAGTITVTVLNSGGTAATYTYGVDAVVVKSATGIYYIDYAPAAAGEHYVKWNATTGTAQARVEDYFSVRPSYMAAGAVPLEPISLTEAKNHLRVDTTDDDDLITALVTVAREYVETATNRTLINQTRHHYLHDWPSGNVLRLPEVPLVSVTSVQYTDDDNSTSTFGTANYYVDTYGDNGIGCIVLNDGSSWPSDTLRETNAVHVTYVAGYGSVPSAVPRPIRQAMLMAVGHWYENREYAVTSGAVPKTLPLAVDALLATYRIPNWDW